MGNLLTIIFSAALAHNVDPDLLFAIAKVESGFKIHAVGTKGELGLFQLRPEFYGDPEDLLDPSSAAETAAALLHEKLQRCASLGKAAFVCYNRGITGGRNLQFPKKTEYYRRVTRAIREAKGLKKTTCLYTSKWRALGFGGYHERKVQRLRNLGFGYSHRTRMLLPRRSKQDLL